jgi:hypothetical protein
MLNAQTTKIQGDKISPAWIVTAARRFVVSAHSPVASGPTARIDHAPTANRISLPMFLFIS